jgi:hypothetical protein
MRAYLDVTSTSVDDPPHPVRPAMDSPIAANDGGDSAESNNCWKPTTTGLGW